MFDLLSMSKLSQRSLLGVLYTKGNLQFPSIGSCKYILLQSRKYQSIGRFWEHCYNTKNTMTIQKFWLHWKIMGFDAFLCLIFSRLRLMVASSIKEWHKLNPLDHSGILSPWQAFSLYSIILQSKSSCGFEADKNACIP